MDCPECGHELREGAKFCLRCGARFTLACASCGTELPPEARFCDGCGAPVAAGTEAVPRRDPRDYTPQHLADKILRSKSALEGERKQVTVLFADVKGSMELAESVDPEEWHAILDRFFEILTDGVHRFEGTVNQYTGDGIMALFGAPIAHEDHAQRACYAVLWLRDALRRYADELRVERGLSFATRMGLNSGEVVVGKIGDDLRMDYTAQGHTVGLAQRMEQLAEPGRVLLTESTAELVSGYFELRDLGASHIQGLPEPVRVFDLQGVGRLRTRLEASRARGFSRFVGRTDEMRTLELALHRAQGGHGQVVGVVGEAGVGKSRLCSEFVESCRAQGLSVSEAHCPAHGKTVPFLPLLELLRSYFGIAEGDSDGEARHKIAGTVLLLDESFREPLPLLLDFLGVPDPDRPAPRMDPEARQRQLYGLVRRLVQARSAREPTLLFVDDVHWIDLASDGFLAQLVEAVSGTRALLLVNFRPEYEADWFRKSHYQQLPLLPLGPEGIEALLRDLLGEDASVAELYEPIRVRTGGNPFFIEEVVQSLAEAGTLEGSRSAYRLRGAVDEVSVPASVQAVLAARIDRLAEREKRVLQTAAVIGKEFSEPLLAAVAELPAVDLAEALRALGAAEFIREAELYPVAVYGFKHPLTQEVALHSQLGERRARVHGSVARALEALRAERLDESAALIAHHWAQAGQALVASRWHRRAAEWAGVSDAVEADRHWRAILELLDPLPPAVERVALLAEAISQIINLGWRVGLEQGEAEVLFARGGKLLRDSGDLRTLAILEARYAFLQGAYGRFDRTLALCRSALGLARDLEDRSLAAALCLTEARALAWFGRMREYGAAIERGLEFTDNDAGAGREIFDYSPYILLMLNKGTHLAWTGYPREGALVHERAMQLARQLGETEMLGFLHVEIVWCNFLLGDNASALRHARRGADILEQGGGAFHRIGAGYFLALALVLDRDWSGVLATVERMRALGAEKAVGLEWLGPALHLVSAARLGRGETAAAREAAREAVELGRGREGPLEVLSRYHQARALLRSESGADLAEAGATLSVAMARVQELGLRGFEPLLREERAELARLCSDPDTWRRELREAHRLYVEMGATGPAERLARELHT